MDEGRLGAVRKSQKYNRKCVHVMNEIIKNRTDLYQGFLSRESHVTHARLMTEVILAKRNVVRNHVLLQCMDELKEHHDGSALLGAYNGRPIASLTRHIDHLVAQNHPKLRRLRLCKKVKENGFKHGVLLDPWTMRSKVEDFFKKNSTLAPLVDLSSYRRETSVGEPRNPLTDESRFRYHAKRPPAAAHGEDVAIATVQQAQGDPTQDFHSKNDSLQTNKNSLEASRLSRVAESGRDKNPTSTSLPKSPERTSCGKKAGPGARRETRARASTSLNSKTVLPAIKTDRITEKTPG